MCLKSEKTKMNENQGHESIKDMKKRSYKSFEYKKMMNVVYFSNINIIQETVNKLARFSCHQLNSQNYSCSKWIFKIIKNVDGHERKTLSLPCQNNTMIRKFWSLKF